VDKSTLRIERGLVNVGRKVMPGMTGVRRARLLHNRLSSPPPGLAFGEPDDRDDGMDSILKQQGRHCEPPGRANARPMTGSAKQSIEQQGRKKEWIASSLRSSQ
jgi:hypothetical protein